MEQSYAKNGEGCYVLEVVAGGRKLCLDATMNHSWGKYINHAPDRYQNVKLHRPLLISGKWRVAFLAVRDISAGEELFLDYRQEQADPEWMHQRKVAIT